MYSYHPPLSHHVHHYIHEPALWSSPPAWKLHLSFVQYIHYASSVHSHTISALPLSLSVWPELSLCYIHFYSCLFWSLPLKILTSPAQPPVFLSVPPSPNRVVYVLLGSQLTHSLNAGRLKKQQQRKDLFYCCKKLFKSTKLTVKGHVLSQLGGFSYKHLFKMHFKISAKLPVCYPPQTINTHSLHLLLETEASHYKRPTLSFI